MINVVMAFFITCLLVTAISTHESVSLSYLIRVTNNEMFTQWLPLRRTDNSLKNCSGVVPLFCAFFIDYIFDRKDENSVVYDSISNWPSNNPQRIHQYVHYRLTLIVLSFIFISEWSRIFIILIIIILPWRETIRNNLQW